LFKLCSVCRDRARRNNW